MTSTTVVSSTTGSGAYELRTERTYDDIGLVAEVLLQCVGPGHSLMEVNMTCEMNSAIGSI